MADERLKNIERFTKLLDSQFKIGRFRFGLDPIINLVPFLGDGVSVIASCLLVFTMYKHGASGKLVIKMLLNIFIDAVIGAIPLIGWLFDFYYKANERNLRLLKEHYTEDKHRGSGLDILLLILILCLVVLGLCIYAAWVFTSWLFDVIF